MQSMTINIRTTHGIMEKENKKNQAIFHILIKIKETSET